MSKYANLPELDTAPDVYETADIPPRDSLSLARSSSSTGAGSGYSTRIGRLDHGQSPGDLNYDLDDEDDDAILLRHRHGHHPDDDDDALDESGARRSGRNTNGGNAGDNIEDDEEAEIVRTSISVANASSVFVKATTRVGNVASGGAAGRHHPGARHRHRFGPNGQRSSRLSLPERDDYSMFPNGRNSNDYNNGEPETRLQRLRRLMFEVEELGQELEQAKKIEEEEEKEEREMQRRQKKELNGSADGDDEEEEEGEEASKEQTQTDPKRAGLGKKKARKKRAVATPGELLEHVHGLQSELGRLGDIAAGTQDAHMLSHGTAAGTLLKHVEAGKALIANLEAFKSFSIRGGDDSIDGGSSVNGTVNGSVNGGESINGQSYTVTDGNVVTYELFYTPETAKAMQLSKMNELEQRITHLEKLIGLHMLQGVDHGDDSINSILMNTGTLLAALDRLDHHMALLTQPRQMDNVSRRVKTLLADMERLMELRKKQQQEQFPYTRDLALMGVGVGSGAASAAGGGVGAASAASAVAASMSTVSVPTPSATGVLSDLDMLAAQTETEKRVNFLFSKLEKLDPIMGVLPQLIARLQALRSLHTEAAVFSESLRMITEEQGKTRETMGMIDGALMRLQGNLKENAAAAERNVKALDQRVLALLDKLSVKGGGAAVTGK
ncbi:Dynactin subunit 2 [Blyttiomyces sp. JEL0837]|nr:Dynactin subunit 2 [Blyttiomyces sp. JEL0837]